MASTATALHGLSRDVTLAVLPRLYIEELVAELSRRNISFGGYSFKQEFLVGVLKDVMTQEYRNIEPDRYPSDGVAANINFALTPDAVLTERVHFQGQILQKSSQASLSICPSPDIENRSTTEAVSRCRYEKHTYTNQESKGKCEPMRLEASPYENASDKIPVSSMIDRTASEGTGIVASATTQPIVQLDFARSPQSDLDDKLHKDETMYCVDPGFQSRNGRSSLKKNSTCSKAPDNMDYSRKDSDFAQHTKIHNASLGIKREEDDRTFQSHLIEENQGKETSEVTTILDPSNTVITGQHIHADLTTEPVLENNEHLSANCNDETVAMCMDGHRERGSYETELDENIAFIDRSDPQVFDNGNKNRSGNDSGMCLEQDTMPYACKDCDYRTKVKQRFVRHIRTHTGERPFKCPYCDYRAIQSTNLKTHMYRHVGEKPYKCSDCEFRTTHKVQLVEHMRTHTGEKPYMCDECGYRSSYRSNLASHMKRHLTYL